MIDYMKCKNKNVKNCTEKFKKILHDLKYCILEYLRSKIK